MELDYRALGLRIAKRRKALGLRQNALAAEIDISNNYLSGIECGKENPSLEVLVKLCNALKVTPDYLLMGNMHSSNSPQNIVEGLRLCSAEDVELVCGIIRLMVERRNEKWNFDNFV